MELSWIGYVSWARKEVKRILSCITDGAYSQGEIYALLRIALNGVINMGREQHEEDIQISILLNHLSNDNEIYIKTNCSYPPITTKQLQRLIADQQSLFNFLSDLSEEHNGPLNRIPYLTIVNALSSFLCVTSKRNGLCSYLRYQKGIDDFILDYTSDENEIELRIVPDEDVFGDVAFNLENVASIAKQCVEESHIMITLQDGAKSMVLKSNGGE